MSGIETRFNEALALYEKWRYAEAVPLLQALANEGYAEAQCKIGWCYYYAQGVEKDYAKAIEWYAKAAKQGYAEAQYILANCYESGEGIEKDRGKAIEWYRKAADQGHVLSQIKIMEKRYEEAKALYNRKQYDKAASLLEALAEEGYADAQYLLGISFEHGRGVMQDYDKAVEWCIKAAEQGNRDAEGWFDKPNGEQPCPGEGFVKDGRGGWIHMSDICP